MPPAPGADRTYCFQVRFDTDEETGLPLAPGPVGTSTVRYLPDDVGTNQFWLISDVPR